MRFKNITELFNKGYNEIQDFFSNCEVIEKINAHYVKVTIQSPTSVICKKGTGEEITLVDMVLNKMWANFHEDWFCISSNPAFKEFAKEYVGCTLCMYYFPVHNPLGTEYDFHTQRCYVINQVYDNQYQRELSLDLAFNELSRNLGVSGKTDIYGRYTILKNKKLKFNDDIRKVIENYNSSTIITDIINNIDKTNIIAKNKENADIILKYEKQQYQITSTDTSDSCGTLDNKERSSYEFVLCDFVKFFMSNNMMVKLRGTYINIVCYLFNEYITKHEALTGYIEKNVDPENLEPPHIGYKHGDFISIAYGVNPLTVSLCDNPLYRNIFKLLLANLKIFKKAKFCIYMNPEQVGSLNTIVKAISIVKTDNYYSHKKKSRI